MIHSDKLWKTIVFALLSVILAVASDGSNYATCLMRLVMSLSVSAVLRCFYRKKGVAVYDFNCDQWNLFLLECNCSGKCCKTGILSWIVCG